MKNIILIGLLFFASVSLSARDFQKNFMSVSFTNIEIFNKEIVPSLGLRISPKVLNRFNFMVSYANNLLSKKNRLQILRDIKNPKIQNIYLSLNYRF